LIEIFWSKNFSTKTDFSMKLFFDQSIDAYRHFLFSKYASNLQNVFIVNNFVFNFFSLL